MTDDRREAVRDQHPPKINGIDFLEVDPADETQLVVHFIFNLPDAPNNPVPPGAPGDALTKGDVSIDGGERITPINVLSATRTADDQLTVVVDRIGDFSVYTLRLRLTNGMPPPGFDPQLIDVDFVFHVECAKRFDCKSQLQCPPEFVPPPPIDYLAKDYPGFVRVMLDRLSLLAPGWRERNPADLGVAVVETLAYVADHLSYRQDAIATEAYVGTARLRTSIRRHTRLVDYRISDGSNARVWLRLIMRADLPAGLPAHTRCATTFGTQVAPVLDHGFLAYSQAVNAGAAFFETMADSVSLFADNNEIALYNWSAKEMCLEVGATSATLLGAHPNLKNGMVLVLAEKKGPRTGDPADADPAKRHVVRLVKDGDPSLTDPLDGTPLTAIEWDPADALPFSLCVSSITDVEHKSQPIVGVSVAWGNIVLADHGRTIGDPLETVPEPIGIVCERLSARFRPALAQGPLTFAAATASGTSASAVQHWSASDTAPSVAASSADKDGNVLQWSAVGDLLDIGVLPDSPVFVAEVENDGIAYLRFGDGHNGLIPPPGASFASLYRVGNGASGNVARESIVLIDTTTANLAAIASLTNPLPAWGGTDPEALEHVRQSAPVAFRTQERAVTLADYRDVALRYAGVRRAAATFRWTGSWYTVFLTIEREANKQLDSGFIAGLEEFVENYRMAGYDLEVEDAHRVPLRIEMHVCVTAGFVATDVELAIREVFSSRVLSDGTLGVFHPDRLNMGEPFYLSPLYERAQMIDGVQSVRIVRFERESQPSDDGLANGVLIPDRLELFVLENDPNFPERGVFELHVDGGL